jgi:hypothetical protein
MEAICLSEMSIDFQRTTWRSTPEDRTLRNTVAENLKSYLILSSTEADHNGRVI